MSPIAFKRSGSSCNYDDSSATNPCLKNGTLGIRKVIGLADKKTWDKEWRPIFINFIESANVTSIDLTKDKARSKNELLTKIREFIELVRDKTASNVPDDFLEAALFILVKDPRSQVVATKKAVVKEEQREQSSRLTSVPANTPAPSLTPAPTSRSEYLAVPLVSGRTPITLQRANSNGLIAVRMAFWGNLTVFPPSLPLAEQLPELSAWKLSIVQQHLKFYQLRNDHETIYWMDSTGTPILLMNDLDLHHMVYAAQNPQETVKAREIVVRGSDNEQVQFPWSLDPSGRVVVRNMVGVQPPVTLKRPSGIAFNKDVADDPLATSKKIRSSKPASIVSGTSSLTIRGIYTRQF